ncbi:hypothetical protein RchiOBHm_Chr2g0126601 [Rosa chinensis]|uniref:Uncharacterized protein n=1 Tax=Rosa chinensis TaxID=74649 RepID=A0A2P6RTU5_ROSCH|nr:hypothetical protein RchiOBHm_Chr2g0126601 [Rosa chinensis]
MFSPSLLTLIYSIFSNFTLLSLPYINTFSSHSKTHSFIHSIFFYTALPIRWNNFSIASAYNQGYQPSPRIPVLQLCQATIANLPVLVGGGKSHGTHFRLLL